jgi:hypothetical protein
MGFYHPATLVKDAQRHGLRVRPIDVSRSDWPCTLEENGANFSLRLGLRYVKSLREEPGREIVRQRGIRPFGSIDDLKLRVSALQKSELTALAEIGALNFVGTKASFHRRDALWQIERVSRCAGPLLETCEETEEAGGRIDYEFFSSAAHDGGRAPGRGLSQFGDDRGPASLELSSPASETARYSLGRRPPPFAGWSSGARRGLRDCATASRHRQGLCVSQSGRRDRDFPTPSLRRRFFSRIMS